MSVYPVTFDFSDRFLSRQKRMKYIVAFTLMVVMLIAMLGSSHFQTQYLGLFALVSVIAGAAIWFIFTLTTRIIVSRLRQMSLDLGPGGLVRKSGVLRQTIPWDNVTKVRFHDYPSGELRAIEVFTPSGSPISLFGYEPMSEVAEFIKEHIPSTAQVESKRHRLNNENPAFMVAIIVLAALCFGAIYKIAGQTISQSLTSFMLIAVGIFFLGYGPLSRANPKLRRWEIGLGVFIMATALLALVITIGLAGHLY